MSQGFYEDRKFHTPAFQLLLNGQDPGRTVAGDVLEVRFTEELGAISSFEFTLYDWDPHAVRPRYSSPWDDQGRPLPQFPGDSQMVPNFEPGARVDLRFGYVEDGDLPLMLRGEVITISPSFPASGTPTCQVRALDAFLRSLQKVHVEGNYDGTDKAIVDQLCRQNQVNVRWVEPESEGEEQHSVVVDGTLYDEIQTRVENYGYVLSTTGAEDSELLLAPSTAAGSEPVLELRWGRTLKEFTPVLSAAAQISEVVVRLADPNAPEGERQLEVVRRFSDIGVDPAAIGPASVADLESAVTGIREIIKPDGALTEADAIKAADAHLHELAGQLITGTGSTVGLPALRAGQVISLAALGARFDGNYRVFKTVHTLGGTGYSTSFEVRKEVLAP
ncbi:hypothetical protein OK351_03450 [Glutamicibacter sp. MNS18]|uniref:phage late control D family protein n=1 Tax=Glutamicibacter sp. MNS18 TaxID=2989817 RepID=UPI0022354959|nr:hypothetical protein [Glutamicibacter sp. MNS18]MCW4464562.1 hypothetical protein [Glutamicibacter sp. MNS18]